MAFAVSAAPADRARMRAGSFPRAAATAVVATAVGLGVGLLWWAVAPRIEIIKVEQGFVYADSQPEQAVAADAWFGILGLAAGLVLAVAAWVVLRRYRGLTVVVGLVVGSVVGAWLGWRLGVWLDRDAFLTVAGGAQLGDHLRAPLSLGMTGLDYNAPWPPRVTGVVLAQPLAVAVVYTTLAGFSADPHLRPAAERTPDVGDTVQSGPWAMTWSPATEPETVLPEPSAPGWPPPATDPGRYPGPASSGPAGPGGRAGWPAPPGSA